MISNQIERFLNIAVNSNIYMWNLQKISDSEITFCVSPDGFKKLRKSAYETSSQIKILNKKGAFVLTKKLKRRKIFLYGTVILSVFLIFISSLILDIEIIGNETVKTDVILEKLSEINLQKFKFRSNIDSDRISLKLINDLDNISWVGVTEKGSKLIIEIKERTPIPKMIPLDEPCHIVAKKDGIIYKMNIENGETVVALNQVVTKGQLLVSGIISTKHDGLRYVHSFGEIVARTWSEKFIDVKLYEYEKVFTGKQMKKHFLKLFSKEFDLSGGIIVPYYNSKETTERKVISFFELTSKTYEEYTLKQVPISLEEAIKRGKEELYNSLLTEYKKEHIKSVEYEITNTDEKTITIRMLANLEEEIGETRKIERD